MAVATSATSARSGDWYWPAAMKVALDGNRIVVSAVVGLKDAKRLLKRLEANIALLEEEEGEAGEAAN